MTGGTRMKEPSQSLEGNLSLLIRLVSCLLEGRLGVGRYEDFCHSQQMIASLLDLKSIVIVLAH